MKKERYFPNLIIYNMVTSVVKFTLSAYPVILQPIVNYREYVTQPQVFGF
jgi:hypothetical protein